MGPWRSTSSPREARRCPTCSSPVWRSMPAPMPCVVTCLPHLNASRVARCRPCWPGHDMSGFDAMRNLGLKAARRLQSAPKPLVRLMRRRARAQEHDAFRKDAEAIDREIARLADGSAPIVAGPWLAEVGYEVLYWIPFLRWFQDAFAVRQERLIVLSRGGM